MAQITGRLLWHRLQARRPAAQEGREQQPLPLLPLLPLPLLGLAECRGSRLRQRHSSSKRSQQAEAHLSCPAQRDAPTHSTLAQRSGTHRAPSRRGTRGGGWLLLGWAPPAAGGSSGTVPPPHGWTLATMRTAPACGWCGRRCAAAGPPSWRRRWSPGGGGGQGQGAAEEQGWVEGGAAGTACPPLRMAAPHPPPT